MLALARWMSDYYLQPLGEVVFQCIPGYLRGARAHHPLRVKRWCLTEADAELIDDLEQRSPRQFEICQALRKQPGGLTAVGLKEINPHWHPVVKALQAKQIVRWEWIERPVNSVPVAELPVLSDEQHRALVDIESRLDRFAVHLLDGITGSGKTEIYLRLIAGRLAAAMQVIYLVPEIGLTNQLIERVRLRFGDCFALSHSGLTELQRYQAWDRFRRGEVSIMLGTRSSLFSQCDRLGLIIIDEEHDHSYRQEDGVRYHARDVAIKRAQMLDIPIVLGSATPSLESIANCKRETYFRYRLDQRPTSYPPPPIQLIDVRNSRFDFGCSAQTFARVEKHLQQDGQVLIYLNRRGFAPIVMCHECGWQALCQNCDSRMTLHQSVQALLCHHCGSRQAIPETCAECGHQEIKHYGIGTEQLEQGLQQRYTDTPILRIDRDTIGSREALKSRLQQLQSGEPCILIGTQMIAKGHDYPAITLSVILDADQALFSASYRSSERLAQTLFQVSGRSGRGDRQGEAILQTRFPEHPLMQALARRDYRAIADDLLQERRLLDFPPYARVVIFRADAVELKAALAKLDEIKALLQPARGFGELSCVGPIPALMTRRIGRYRAQLCLLAQDYQLLRSVLAQAMPEIQQIPGSSRVSWSIDVDAYDL
jgi:primosomal protein N' (replication factor Y)